MNKYNTFRCRLVAKKFPVLQEKILDKISLKNGFSLKEVREYKSKLRSLAIGALSGRSTCYFHEDKYGHLDGIMVFADTKDGNTYWRKLHDRLQEIARNEQI